MSTSDGLEFTLQSESETSGSDLSADPFEIAEVLGLDIVLPGENELLLDIDDPADLAWVDKMLEVARDNQFPMAVIKCTRSKSGGHHLYMKVGDDYDITPLERVLLQACFGSDRKRELLSYFRIKFQMDRPPTVFFEVKQ